jgi:hypothetical protein
MWLDHRYVTPGSAKSPEMSSSIQTLVKQAQVTAGKGPWGKVFILFSDMSLLRAL